MQEQMPNKDDALFLIHSRNAFYKRKYHFLSGVAALALIIIAVLAGILHRLMVSPTHPIYFATDKIGKLIQQIPLTELNMSKEELLLWAVEAVQGANTYDYINYRQQLQNAQKYFTSYGWHTYMQGLAASNNLVGLTQRKMIQVTKVVDAPKIIFEGRVAGRRAYKIEMPILMTFYKPPYADKDKFQDAYTATIIVQRQDVLDSYGGLGIIQIIITAAA
jgi:intracellular multiplication protein IcmL